MIPRLLKPALVRAAHQFPVVTVTGPLVVFHLPAAPHQGTAVWFFPSRKESRLDGANRQLRLA
jgi:hypothetical protein